MDSTREVVMRGEVVPGEHFLVSRDILPEWLEFPSPIKRKKYFTVLVSEVRFFEENGLREEKVLVTWWEYGWERSVWVWPPALRRLGDDGGVEEGG